VKQPASIVTIGILALAMITATWSHAQAGDHQSFASTKDAVDALIQALRERDKAKLQAILGPDSAQIVSSGDDLADKNARDRFISEYETEHALVKTGSNRFILSVGQSDWPLPIPLVQANGRWYWDGAAGKEELLYRRIGRNELAAIDVCKGVIAAQREYASRSHDGQPAGTYASKIISDTGKQNGLYWEISGGQPPSPAGPLLAQANAEGYDSSGGTTPYHGYYYRMLKRSGGFGFMAYPAEYRTSGVMTFLVDQTGAIYQKDLGEQTADIVQRMTAYKRDGTWVQVK
jgi:hypothetical protein